MTDHKCLVNPFDSDAVTSPEQPIPGDVPEIHHEAFDLCVKSYDRVARRQSSWSVLLHGEAGCGKTHLLSRFRRWLSGELETKPSQIPALMVAIRMETAPSQIWRHIRRRFALGLTAKGGDDGSSLGRILGRVADSPPDGLTKAIETSDMPEDLAKVLEHYAAGLNRRLCRAWLVGDGLSDADLQVLNLSSTRLEEVEGEFGEDIARRIVLAIVKLAAPAPVVFCFDQVEALGIALHVAGSYGSFKRAGAALIDGTSNVLLISTILTTFLRELERGPISSDSMLSDYQRISKDVADLHPLDIKQGSALIDSRLKLIPELKGLDPIPGSALRDFYAQQHGSCNARILIHEARRLFAKWQGSTGPIEVSMPDFLHTEFERHWANAEVRNQLESADVVLAHGLPVVLEMLGKKATSTSSGLTVGEGKSCIEVVFANQSSMQGLAAAMRHLLNRRTPDASLRLIRDQRLPISATATATQERLKKIEESGGRFVRVEAAALAALDAMRKLLTEATSGDLSANGKAIEAKTVREWLRQNLPQEVQQLAAALLGEESTEVEDPSADALLEVLAKRKVLPAGEAAQVVGWSTDEIETFARNHPLQVRWFGGTSPVVCQAFGSGAVEVTNHVQ